MVIARTFLILKIYQIRVDVKQQFYKSSLFYIYFLLTHHLITSLSSFSRDPIFWDPLSVFSHRFIFPHISYMVIVFEQSSILKASFIIFPHLFIFPNIPSRGCLAFLYPAAFLHMHHISMQQIPSMSGFSFKSVLFFMYTKHYYTSSRLCSHIFPVFKHIRHSLPILCYQASSYHLLFTKEKPICC